MENQTVTPRFATADEISSWNSLIEVLPECQAWQSLEYSRVKTHQRYKPRFVMAGIPILVLEKKVPLLGKIWYLPAGPMVKDFEQLQSTLGQLSAFARKNGAFLLKLEPHLLKTDEIFRELSRIGVEQTAQILPDVSTVMLDTSGTEEEVMARFSSSTRTKIRRADKLGFEIRSVPVDEVNCEIMYGLMKETAAGQFELRPYSYYKDFWQTFQNADRGQLMIGYFNDLPVAGGFVIAYGETSIYKDGASTRTHELPNGAMYRMQWEQIVWGRARGATRHDLLGSPPSDQLDDKSHQLHGVGQFKLRLSKEVTDFVGTLDYPLAPTKVKLWRRLGDPLARRWSLAIHRDIYY